MTDSNGWPGAPGVPLNPERDGWHWLHTATWPICCYWVSDHELSAWTTPVGDDALLPSGVADWRYLGPCLLPSEVAAREAAAAEAMREACAALVDAHAAAAKRRSEEGDVIYRIRAEFLANSYAIQSAADDVRVTPIPENKP